MSERHEPHDEEAEQLLLGAMLLDARQIDAVGEHVTSDDFYIGVHGRLYDAVCELRGKGVEAKPSTLKPLLEHDEGFGTVGFGAYVGRLVSNVPATTIAPEWAKRVRNLSRKRRLQIACEDALERLKEPEDANAQIEALEAALFDLADRDAAGSVQSLGQALAEMLEYAEKQSTGEVIPVDTGLRELDVILDGLMPGDLTIIGARPAIGKTSFASGVALHNAREGRPVGFFQMEMHGRQMAARAMSGVLGIPAKPILRGRLRYEEWEALAKAQEELQKLPIHIDARAGVPLDQFIPRARRMKRSHGIELLIVDYLGLIRVPGATSYERVTQVSQMMKELARDLDIHVIALHQLNRANEREARRPTLADLRDSGSVEQDADNVIFLHREEVALRKTEPDPGDMAKHGEWAQKLHAAQGRAEIIVDKQRNGSTGTALCRFDARTTTFGDA